MPARKTIAERNAATNRSRARRIMTIVGIVPVVVLVVVVGVFAYRHFTAVGPGDLPSSIGQGDRDAIESAIDDFYGAVNEYKVETLLNAIGWDDPKQIPQPEVDRVVIELSAVLAEQHKFQLQTLGATDLQDGRVSARVVTNFGTKTVYLNRKAGQWRVIAPIDILVPQQAGAVALEWKVLNTFPADDGKSMYVAGTMKNVSNRLGFLVSPSAYIADSKGATLSALAGAPPFGSPFIYPGGETYFQIRLGMPSDGSAFDINTLVLVPDFRPSGPNDDQVVVKTVSATPPLLPWRPDSGQQVTVASTGVKPVEVQTYAVLRDAAGGFLGLWALKAGTIQPAQTQTVPAPAALPVAIRGIAQLEIRVYGATRG